MVSALASGIRPWIFTGTTFSGPRAGYSCVGGGPPPLRPRAMNDVHRLEQGVGGWLEGLYIAGASAWGRP